MSMARFVYTVALWWHASAIGFILNEALGLTSRVRSNRTHTYYHFHDGSYIAWERGKAARFFDADETMWFGVMG